LGASPATGFFLPAQGAITLNLLDKRLLNIMISKISFARHDR